MSKITIPSAVLPGFTIIMSLNEEEVKKVTSFLSQIPVGIKFGAMVDGLSASIEIKKATEIVKTLTSFSELLGEPNVDYEVLADNLTKSYEILVEGVPADSLLILRNNLTAIFQSSLNLNLVLKARDLIIENNNNFEECRIVTDIRLVFNDDLEEKKRHSVIIHRLRIEYREDARLRGVYFSLDLGDLKSLKEEIERAIRKEEIIRGDYGETVKFI